MAECSIETCCKRAEKRGWCAAHYSRWRKYGSPHTVLARHKDSTDPLPTEKRCVACKAVKGVAEFGPRPERPSGLRSRCRECDRSARSEYHERKPEVARAYRQANKDKAREGTARYRAKHHDLVRKRENEIRAANREKYRAADRERYHRNIDKQRERRRLARLRDHEATLERERRHREDNREAVNAASRRACAKRRATPQGKLENTIRAGIHVEITRGSKRGRKTFDLLGYTAENLKAHIERQFQPGMSWDNYSLHGWHIDHIKPVSAFNYSTPDDPDFRACWALTNLRPLWAKDNLSKGARRLLLV